MMIVKTGIRPVHPGEILREEFMAPLGLSANALARPLHVTRPSSTTSPLMPRAA